MSSQTATVPESTGQQRIDKIPFSRLVRVELRKTYDTRAGFWLLLTIAVLTLAIVVLFLIFADAEDLTYNNFVGISATPQGFLLPVLGILAITSEWSQRAGLVSFTLEPSRSRILLAKIAAVIVLAIVFYVLALLFGAIGNVLGQSLMDGDGTWDVGVDALRDYTILQLAGILGGLAFGMVLLNSAAAIVLSFVLPTAFGILFGIIPALEDAARWIDFGTAQGPLFDHTMTSDDWAPLFVTSLWWIWIPLAFGAWRVMRSEVK